MGWVLPLDACAVEKDVDSAVWEGVGLRYEVGNDEANRGLGGEICRDEAAGSTKIVDGIASVYFVDVALSGTQFAEGWKRLGVNTYLDQDDVCTGFG